MPVEVGGLLEEGYGPSMRASSTSESMARSFSRATSLRTRPTRERRRRRWSPGCGRSSGAAEYQTAGGLSRPVPPHRSRQGSAAGRAGCERAAPPRSSVGGSPALRRSVRARVVGRAEQRHGHRSREGHVSRGRRHAFDRSVWHLDVQCRRCSSAPPVTYRVERCADCKPGEARSTASLGRGVLGRVSVTVFRFVSTRTR